MCENSRVRCIDHTFVRMGSDCVRCLAAWQPHHLLLLLPYWRRLSNHHIHLEHSEGDGNYTTGNYTSWGFNPDAIYIAIPIKRGSKQPHANYKHAAYLWYLCGLVRTMPHGLQYTKLREQSPCRFRMNRNNTNTAQVGGSTNTSLPSTHGSTLGTVFYYTVLRNTVGNIFC